MPVYSLMRYRKEVNIDEKEGVEDLEEIKEGKTIIRYIITKNLLSKKKKVEGKKKRKKRKERNEKKRNSVSRTISLVLQLDIAIISVLT